MAGFDYVRKKQLLTLHAESTNQLLTALLYEPVDELLAFHRLDMRVLLWVDQNHRIRVQ